MASKKTESEVLGNDGSSDEENADPKNLISSLHRWWGVHKSKVPVFITVERIEREGTVNHIFM